MIKHLGRLVSQMPIGFFISADAILFYLLFSFPIMYIFEISEQNRIEIYSKGGGIMTAKELLYVEDALGHEQYFQTKCKETANQIQDAELKACVEQMAQKHKQIFQSFYSLL